jgi:hypothetical protein
LHEIGRAFGKDHISIQFTLAQHRGIVPAARRRSPLTLILAEREDISRGIACGSSIRDIAQSLAFDFLEVMPANEIMFLDFYKKTLSECCIDPLRPPGSSSECGPRPMLLYHLASPRFLRWLRRLSSCQSCVINCAPLPPVMLSCHPRPRPYPVKK